MSFSLQTIRNHYDSLTPAEQRIADYILAHSEAVTEMTTEQLAQASGAAKSAVIRCCQSLGFEGYTQLKRQLTVELSKNRQLNYVPYIYANDGTQTILEKVFSANVKALHDTLDHLDASVMEAVLDKLQSARQIFLYGVGTSASMVMELQYRLMLLGYSAFAMTDPGTMKISTMNISSGDVALAISYSGRTIATKQALSLAAQAGATTICITSYPQSPLALASQLPLCVYSDEVQYPVEAMSAKIAQLSLIYAMTTALSARTYKDTVLRAKRTRELINSIRQEDTK